MKPILFNTEMVRAILAGRKTQTRRVIRVLDCPYHQMRYSPYDVGDILYVRETWKRVYASEDYYEFGSIVSSEELFGYRYKADNKVVWDERAPRDNEFYLPYITEEIKWHPSIHMPKKAARLFLRVTDVRAERLWDSFNAPTTPILTVQAEGIDIGDTCRDCIFSYGMPCCVDTLDDDGSTIGECGMLDENRGEFADLWDSTIKPADRDRYGWAANPWVWVICFERCEDARNGE